MVYLYGLAPIYQSKEEVVGKVRFAIVSASQVNLDLDS